MHAAAIAVLAIAFLYELLIQTLGLAWFWGGFSVCERAYLLMTLLALILGASGLFVRGGAAPMLLSVALASMIIGLVIAGAVEARAELFCGAPIEANYSMTFFLIGGALALWSAYRLAVAIAKRSRT